MLSTYILRIDMGNCVSHGSKHSGWRGFEEIKWSWVKEKQPSQKSPQQAYLTIDSSFIHNQEK